ncbi:hypothetical protein ABFY60_26805 [Lysinibacillus pakistanensis]|uniref:hypothetical protein n=1 Tax=Lysinibacillus pakistanensis TaxID=759811 RepID=UPI003D26E637
MFQSKLNGSVCYEVKTYRYVNAGKNMAEFELMFFEDGGIGTQGEILSTKENFSPGQVYKNIDEAVQDMIDIIEKKLKDDEWIKKTQQYNF